MQASTLGITLLCRICFACLSHLRTVGWISSTLQHKYQQDTNRQSGVGGFGVKETQKPLLSPIRENIKGPKAGNPETRDPETSGTKSARSKV